MVSYRSHDRLVAVMAMGVGLAVVGEAGEAAVVGREQARAAGWVVVVWEGAHEEVQAVVVVRAVV